MPPDFGIDPEKIHSGAQHMVGYDIDLRAGDGSARVILDIAPKHLNRNGTLHGGIISMLLDAAAGFAASRRATPTEFAHVVTISLNTQFVAAVRSGQVIATGRLTGGGMKIVHSGAALHDADGGLLASATGVFKRLKETAP